MIPIKPMLAVSGRVFSGKDWIFEPKIDGTRCIAHISGGKVELQNRRSRSITNRFPEVTAALQQAAKAIAFWTERWLSSPKASPVFPHWH